MHPILKVHGRVLPLYRPDIDTDQIMPKQFLTRTSRSGFGEHVFHEWRRDPQFVLNDQRFLGANILVTGRNFASGSSREHAVWGLQQWGIDAVLAPSFSDIFVGNCVQNGLLPATIPDGVAAQIAANALAHPAEILDVDLVERRVRGHGFDVEFVISEHDQESLLLGRDDVSMILEAAEAIDTLERNLPTWASGLLASFRHAETPPAR